MEDWAVWKLISFARETMMGGELRGEQELREIEVILGAAAWITGLGVCLEEE